MRLNVGAPRAVIRRALERLRDAVAALPAGGRVPQNTRNTNE